MRLLQLVDGADLAIVLGLALLGVSVGLVWGWAAVLAYVGTVLIVGGVMLAMTSGARK
jgi:hypothetical protein